MEQETFKISVHPKHYSSKPTDAYNLQDGYTTTDTTLQGLKEIVYNGQTIVPSILKDGYRKNANFSGSQVIFLDFDDNQNPQTEIEKYNEYGINVNLFYNSYSHKEDYNKFRLVIVFDTIIEDALIFKKTMNALIKVGGSDEATKDLARMFYAGTNAEVLNDNINKWDDVKGAITDLINKDKCLTQHKRTSKKLEKVTNNTMPYNTIGIVESVTKRKLQNFDYKEACSKSTVFNSFDKGEIHLKYLQLRALISNMMFVESGLKYVKEKMILRGDYNGDDWALLRRIPNAGYSHAEGMSSFDSSIQDKFHNILDLDNKNRDVITRTREIIKKPVNEVYEAMEKHHANALVSANRVSVINAPTGTGKSRLIIKQKEVIIALPTHKLKDELAVDMKEAGLDFVITPEPPQFITRSLAKRYSGLQSMGESSLASKLLNDVSEGVDLGKNIDYTEDDVQIALDHKNALQIAYEADVTVLTTHQRVMLTPNSFKNKKTVYFDEDIAYLLLSDDSYNVKQATDKIKRLVDSAKEGSDFQKDILMVQANVDNIFEDTSTGTLNTSIKYHDKEGFFTALASREGCSKLAKFLKSGECKKLTTSELGTPEFAFGSVNNVSSHFTKVIILSASAERYFYDEIFKINREGDYDFWDCGFAENEAPIVQYLSKSYSGGQMKRGEFPEVNTPELVITHKRYTEHFAGNKNNDVWFGNTEGINKYMGMNMSVVGIMIPPVNTTIMKCVLLKKDYKSTEKGFNTVKLDYYTFKFFTFNDKNLRQIEMRTIQKPLEQAVGRARTTRTNAKVDVHTSLPLAVADGFKDKNEMISINENPKSLNTKFIKKVDVLVLEMRQFVEDIKNDDTILYDFQRDDVIQLEIFKVAN